MKRPLILISLILTLIACNSNQEESTPVKTKTVNNSKSCDSVAMFKTPKTIKHEHITYQNINDEKDMSQNVAFDIEFLKSCVNNEKVKCFNDSQSFATRKRLSKLITYQLFGIDTTNFGNEELWGFVHSYLGRVDNNHIFVLGRYCLSVTSFYVATFDSNGFLINKYKLTTSEATGAGTDENDFVVCLSNYNICFVNDTSFYSNETFGSFKAIECNKETYMLQLDYDIYRKFIINKQGRIYQTKIDTTIKIFSETHKEWSK